MKQVSVIGFLALGLVPALVAELLPRIASARQVRLWARLAAFAAFGIACALSATLYAAPVGATLFAHMPLGFGGHALHFILDALNGPLLPMLALLTLALVLGGPERELSTRSLRALLWFEALSLVALATGDLAVLAAAWSALLIPAYLLTVLRPQGVDRAVLRRVYTLYHGFGLACFLGACAGIAYFTRPTGFLDMSLVSVDFGRVPEAARPVLFGLLAIAALLRMGITPFHSWLPVAFERGSFFAVTLLVSMRTGLYILARLAIPAFPEVAHDAMPILTALALFSAMYGALAALGQHDLRRLIGFWVVSQSGIMLTGLVFGDPHAVSGTLLYWLSFGVATTGLVLMTACLEARTGSSDMRSFGGIVRLVPNLAACFFLFGLATIAIPGTVAFVAEDMLVHGALEAHPLLTIVMIVAMVLNAVTFVRAFKITFLGERRPTSMPLGTLQDLLPHERFTAVMLVLALVLAGLFPGPLVAAQSPAAKTIAYMEQLGR